MAKRDIGKAGQEARAVKFLNNYAKKEMAAEHAGRSDRAERFDMLGNGAQLMAREMGVDCRCKYREAGASKVLYKRCFCGTRNGKTSAVRAYEWSTGK